MCSREAEKVVGGVFWMLVQMDHVMLEAKSSTSADGLRSLGLGSSNVSCHGEFLVDSRN